MQHWTDYWKSTNALNSFAEGEQGKGYQKEIADFWEKQFSKITTNANVVDLGTGNGAVAVLAQKFSQQHQKNWEVTGIDAANIEPEKLQIKDKSTRKALESIKFIPNTPIEKLPFRPNSVDAFISQFAFEYSNILKSLTQCYKSLKKDGFISLICHHPESDISQDSFIGEEVLQTILLESPAFMQTDLLLDIAQQQEKSGQMRHWPNNPYRQNITATLHWIFERLSHQFKSNNQQNYWCSSTITQITNILKQIGSIPANQLREHLQQNYKNLDSHRLRLKDQNKACLTEAKLKTIQEFCNNNSADFIQQEISVEGKLFGSHILITK